MAGPLDFFTVVDTQRALRRFRSDPVPDAAIRRVIAAATRAPSARGARPRAQLRRGPRPDRLLPRPPPARSARRPGLLAPLAACRLRLDLPGGTECPPRRTGARPGRDA